jgi:uncharacterized protein (DUF2062 family)
MAVLRTALQTSLGASVAAGSKAAFVTIVGFELHIFIVPDVVVGIFLRRGKKRLLQHTHILADVFTLLAGRA